MLPKQIVLLLNCTCMPLWEFGSIPNILIIVLNFLEFDCRRSLPRSTCPSLAIWGLPSGPHQLLAVNVWRPPAWGFGMSTFSGTIIPGLDYPRGGGTGPPPSPRTFHTPSSGSRWRPAVYFKGECSPAQGCAASCV